MKSDAKIPILCSANPMIRHILRGFLMFYVKCEYKFITIFGNINKLLDTPYNI